MKTENLYYIGITSSTEFFRTHSKFTPIYYSIGRFEIGQMHGIFREKWTITFSDVQGGLCRYYAQTIGYTDRINGEPFNRETYDKCFERAEDLRNQIKNANWDYEMIEGRVSFPKDLILLEGNDIKYDKETNRFLFNN
jgi:hypothetical protein